MRRTAAAIGLAPAMTVAGRGDRPGRPGPGQVVVTGRRHRFGVGPSRQVAECTSGGFDCGYDQIEAAEQGWRSSRFVDSISDRGATRHRRPRGSAPFRRPPARRSVDGRAASLPGDRGGRWHRPAGAASPSTSHRPQPLPRRGPAGASSVGCTRRSSPTAAWKQAFGAVVPLSAAGSPVTRPVTACASLRCCRAAVSGRPVHLDDGGASPIGCRAGDPDRLHWGRFQKYRDLA
jgi:hypothetical protein